MKIVSFWFLWIVIIVCSYGSSLSSTNMLVHQEDSLPEISESMDKLVKGAGKAASIAPRYNYFVGLKLSSPSLYAAVEELKSKLETKNSNYKKIFTPTAKMHLTLVLAALESQVQIDDAKEALASCDGLWRDFTASITATTAGERETCPTMHFDHLGNFGSNVLWLAPENGPSLAAVRNIAQCVLDKLLSAGIVHCQVNEQLHATVAKTNMKTRKLIKIKKEDFQELEDIVTQPNVFVEVHDIDLMKIGSTDKGTGYYQSIASIRGVGHGTHSADVAAESSGSVAVDDMGEVHMAAVDAK